MKAAHNARICSLAKTVVGNVAPPNRFFDSLVEHIFLSIDSKIKNMDALISLISPVGLIPLVILSGGVILFVLVALGGWGERTMSNNSRTFLAILGTILTLIGFLGIILIVYPVLRPNVIQIQQDLNLPNSLSTPLPKPTPTPLSPRDQAIKKAGDIGLAVLMTVMFLPILIMMYGMAIGTARTMLRDDFSSPTFSPKPFKLPGFKTRASPRESRSITYKPNRDKNEE